MPDPRKPDEDHPQGGPPGQDPGGPPGQQKPRPNQDLPGDQPEVENEPIQPQPEPKR